MMEKHSTKRTLPVGGVRFAFSLIELLAVLAVLGILAAAAMGHYAASSQGNIGGRADARRLMLDLNLARSRAISTGDNHVITFINGGSGIAGYVLQRRLPDTSLVSVDSTRLFSPETAISLSAGNPEFTFEGAALAAYEITITSASKSWEVSVVPVTGAVQIAAM